MVTFDFSIFDLVTMMAVIVLAVLYVTILIKLKPSTENKDHHKKDFLAQKRKPSSNDLVYVNSLKPKERITPPQRTQTKINPQNMRRPSTMTVRPTAPPEKNQEASKQVIMTENQSSNPYCLHHFSYLRTLPKNTPIPSECLGCRQVVECMTTLKIEKKLVKSHVTNS